MTKLSILSTGSSSGAISKHSPLKETLVVNKHIMGEIPTGISDQYPSPTAAATAAAAEESTPPIQASWPSDEKVDSFPTTSSNDDANNNEANQQQQQQQQQQRPTLLRELFTYLNNRSRTKKLITLLVILSFIPVILDFVMYNSAHVSYITSSFLDWMRENGDVGVAIYVLVLGIMTLLFVPPSIFVFASGFIFQDVYGGWGILIAWLSSFLGALLGGSLGFIRARYLSRDLVEILMRRYPLLRAVDKAICKNSLRVMVLMRLNCLIPFGVLNYVFGISGVDLGVFILSIPAVLPWYFFLVCLGAVSNNMYVDGIQDNMFGLLLMSTGVSSGIIGLIITWRFAKKELKKDAELNQWREVNAKNLPEVTSRSNVVVVDEENPSSNSNNDTSLRIDELNGTDKQEIDDYNENAKIEETISSDSNLGEKVKQVVRKLKLKSKKKDTTTTPSSALSRERTHTNIIEESDLECRDYFRTQVLGEDVYYDENGKAAGQLTQSYRTNLGWTELILDDFS
jgi:uncharacterized membrane protein YdjX (TVP38/TMEM64 family)